MNVTSLHWPRDQPLTAPFPLRNGVFIALRSGAFYSPDSWDVAKVSKFRRGKVRNRPYFSARAGRFGMYAGWKVYGVDTDNQRAMPGIAPSDVYPGSVAIQGCTLRFTRGLT